MSRPLHLVGAQIAPVGGDPEATFERFSHEVRTIRSSFPKAQMYLFPELYLAGEQPFRAGVPMRGNRHTVPGPFTDRIGEVAKRARRWIQAGSIYEEAGAKTYNTALLFGPDGSLVSSYRKLFPWMPFEATDPGNSPPPVVDLARLGRVGMMICYDGWFPEVARGLALQGAEVILHPTLTSTPDREEELVLARSNAIVNQCYVVNINMGGIVGAGRSTAVDPEGRVLFVAGSGEELLPEVLDLEHAAEVRRRGTRGISRPMQHFLDGPIDAVLAPYDRVREARSREGGSPSERS